MTINTLTFLISIFFLPVYFIWEMTVLWLHSKGHFGGAIAGRGNLSVATISMVMQHRAYQLTALPLFWASMMAHWWWNWFDGNTYETPYPAVAFWLIVAITLGTDIWLWNTPFNTLHPVLKFYRAPMVQCVLGFVAGWVLFPQAMTRLPGWRWW